MERTDTATGIRTRIVQLVFGLLFLGALFYFFCRAMAGSKSYLTLFGMLSLGAWLSIGLDKNYWLLAPLFWIGVARLPGLPFDGWEVACLFLSGIHFIRLGLRRDYPASIDKDIFPVLPLLCWMGLVFFLNPTGMSIFGSSAVGGRFYLKVALGFTAMLALSAQRVDENGARHLFYVLLVSMTWRLLRGIVIPSTDPDDIYVGGAASDVNSRYALLFAASVYTVLFSKWSLSDIVRSSSRIFLMTALAGLTILSGKRSAFARLALTPLFRVFLTAREKLLTVVMSFIALVLLVFVSVGDGTFYELPQSAKRALAIVSPNFARRDDGGIRDVFRHEMRAAAREQIRANPLFGRKGFAMDFETSHWTYGHGGPFGGHILAGAWHSALYAYPADFGIPCLLFFLYLAYHILNYVFRACKLVVKGVYLPAVCLYCSFELLFLFVFSYTSGHASMTTMELMLRYGLLLAVVRGYRKQQGLPESV